MRHELLGPPGELAVRAIKELRRQLGQHRPRRDRVREDSLRRKLQRHRARKMRHRGLRRHEGTLEAHGREPHHRADVDDPPPLAPRQHRAARRLAHQVKPIEIDGGDPLPLLSRKAVDVDPVRQGVDPGIVDQDVEPPRPRQRRLNRPRNPVAIPHIKGKSKPLRQPSSNPFGARDVDVGNPDRRAAVRQPPRDTAPDLSRRTGHDGNPARQITPHRPLPRHAGRGYPGRHPLSRVLDQPSNGTSRPGGGYGEAEGASWAPLPTRVSGC